MFEYKRKGSSVASRVVSNRIFAKWYFSLGLYCIATYWLWWFLTNVQNTPYMDEVFHVPQLRRYCNGAFYEWDPKITTPPGLYLFTSIFTWPLSRLLGNPELCGDIRPVRATVALSSTFIPVLVCSILRLLHGIKDEKGATTHIIVAFTTALFPVLYFFNFLYYTDVLSTTLVLSTFWFYLRESYSLSAFTGLLSLFLRQTNIMWVFLCAVLTVFRVLRKSSKREFSPGVVSSFKYFSLLWHHTLENSLKNLTSFTDLLVQLFKTLWAYASVGVLFIIFLSVNGSIVLGDKNAHVAVLHFPQVLYFCAFTLFFTSPLILSEWRSFVSSLKSRSTAVVVMTAVAFVMIRYYTMVHPYLLADNRHYSFYLWRWIMNRYWWTRYALIPVYVISALWIQHLLQDSDIVFRLVWVLCTSACLVPQKLLEFRYFIIPFVLLRLQYTRARNRELILEFLLYICVNAATVYLFVTKKIRWDDLEDDQRIIW